MSNRTRRSERVSRHRKRVKIKRSETSVAAPLSIMPHVDGAYGSVIKYVSLKVAIIDVIEHGNCNEVCHLPVLH
jgi:hypothetical protein